MTKKKKKLDFKIEPIDHLVYSQSDLEQLRKYIIADLKSKKDLDVVNMWFDRATMIINGE